jgi:hypothetical protein
MHDATGEEPNQGNYGRAAFKLETRISAVIVEKCFDG